MKHVNASIGENYWTVRSMHGHNAVCLVRVKIVDIGNREDFLFGKWCLCAEARDDKNDYANDMHFDGVEAVSPFWTAEAYLYTSVEAAMSKLQMAIHDGIKEMSDFFQSLKERGTDIDKRNQLVMFPLDIIEIEKRDDNS